MVSHRISGGLAAAGCLWIGCGCSSPADSAKQVHKGQLTPGQFLVLSDDDKARYKTVTIRVPSQWGGALLPGDSAPFDSPWIKSVHTGDTGTVAAFYNQTLFELQHPAVKVEFLNFDMWSDNFKSALAVALAAHRAPSYYIARDLPETIDQGLYADLTPIMRKWDQFHNEPESSVRQGTFNGHIYTLAANEFGATVIVYRKDWFNDAGIRNSAGYPGPQMHWTWDDFRRCARALTNPAKERYGYVGDLVDLQTYYDRSHGVELYVPDATGAHTWRFNRSNPGIADCLRQLREMAAVEKSVYSTVSMSWSDWHNEFEAGHAAMITGFSAHPPRDALMSPHKFGANRLYGDVVGIAALPEGLDGVSAMEPLTNPIGFDPTLSPEQLQAAFDWCTSWFYGDIYVNRMRADRDFSVAKGERSTTYADILLLPYKPKADLLDCALSTVFPADYLSMYARLRKMHAVPLPREFGLREPPGNELTAAMKAMVTEAVNTNEDIPGLARKTADLIDGTLLNFGGGPGERVAMRNYVEARNLYYKRYFPHFFADVWVLRPGSRAPGL